MPQLVCNSINNYDIELFTFFLQMPHESTVDPEEPIRFKSWGDEASQSDTPDRQRITTDQTLKNTPRLNHAISLTTTIQTHPGLPLHVTHDHDDDGDPDDDNPLNADQDLEFDLRSRVTYTPPKRNSEAKIQ